MELPELSASSDLAWEGNGAMAEYSELSPQAPNVPAPPPEVKNIKGGGMTSRGRHAPVCRFLVSPHPHPGQGEAGMEQIHLSVQQRAVVPSSRPTPGPGWRVGSPGCVFRAQEPGVKSFSLSSISTTLVTSSP